MSFELRLLQKTYSAASTGSPFSPATYRYHFCDSLDFSVLFENPPHQVRIVRVTTGFPITICKGSLNPTGHLQSHICLFSFSTELYPIVKLHWLFCCKLSGVFTNSIPSGLTENMSFELSASKTYCSSTGSPFSPATGTQYPGPA